MPKTCRLGFQLRNLKRYLTSALLRWEMMSKISASLWLTRDRIVLGFTRPMEPSCHPRRMDAYAFGLGSGFHRYKAMQIVENIWESGLTP